MKFKYSQYPAPGGKSVHRPSIPIIFKCCRYSINTKAIVDSGSDCTILPIEIAKDLDLKLDVKTKEVFYGAGKNPFNVYKSPVKITHILKQSGFRPIEWQAYVYFAESQPCILLGNYGFLDFFKVTLDGINKEVEINE